MVPEVQEEYEEDHQFFYETAMRMHEWGDNIPSEVMNRIVSGEHPLKVFREYRRMSQEKLARKVGVNPDYIDCIEEGKSNAPAHILEKMASALRVQVEEIA